MNYASMIEVIYKHEDSYTNPLGEMKENISMLLVNQYRIEGSHYMGPYQIYATFSPQNYTKNKILHEDDNGTISSLSADGYGNGFS